MEHILKNGKTIIIRKPDADDAEGIINLISTADKETKFLARNSGEFCTTTEEERTYINSVLSDESQEWYVAEYDDRIIGMCSVGLVNKGERFRHRAEVTYVILRDYCGIGIGGKLMKECLEWCKSKNVLQVELDVVSDNERAIRMYEGFGFRITGTIPKAMRYPDGTFADKKFMVLELI